jgi:translation initiation factor IF-2
MNNKKDFITKMVEGDQIKQDIYEALVKKNMSRKECADMMGLTKNQFTHYINYLVENMHVKITVGKCKLHKKDKVHIFLANIDYPFVARTREQIQKEFDERYKHEQAIKPHARVIKLIDSRPYNYHKDDRKKQEFGIQSSFNIL